MTNQKIKLHAAAVELIEARGLVNVTVDDVCRGAGVPTGSFTHYAETTFINFLVALQRSGNIGPPVLANKNRIDPLLMRVHLLTFALDLAKEGGYKNIRRDELAARAGTSRPTTHRIFPTMKALYDQTMQLAIEQNIARIVAQGLALDDPLAIDAPGPLKKQAVKWLADKC